jgi:hypothetical protein
MLLRLSGIAALCAVAAAATPFTYPKYFQVVERLHALDAAFPQFVEIWSAQVGGAEDHPRLFEARGRCRR